MSACTRCDGVSAQIGGPIASLFRDGGAGTTVPGIVAGRTVGDFVEGLNPFAR